MLALARCLRDLSVSDVLTLWSEHARIMHGSPSAYDPSCDVCRAFTVRKTGRPLD